MKRSSQCEETGEALRFEKEYQYDNGDAYRVWEFLADCPELHTSRPGMGAPHVIAGDKLVQDEDEERGFRVKRRGRKIGHFEWWQLKDYFPHGLPRWSGEIEEKEEDTARGFLRYVGVSYKGVGLDAWALTEPKHASYEGELEEGTILFTYGGGDYFQRPGCAPRRTHRAVRELYRWHNNIRYPERSAALALVRSSEDYDPCSVGLIEVDVPGTPLTAGDVLLLTGRIDEVSARGRIVPLSLEDYELVRASIHPAGLAITNITPEGWGWCTAPETLSEFFRDRRSWGKSLKVWRPRAFVVKPLRPESVEVIVADSEDAAIFELLSQVGCRMPMRGAR